MILRLSYGAILATFCSSLVLAQVRVSPDRMHDRALLILPLTGSGTFSDPIRPLLSPAGVELNEIVSWTWQPSDDGKLAIVELVTRDRAVLRKYADDKRVIKAFERGKDTSRQIETELKVLRRTFSADRPEVKKP